MDLHSYLIEKILNAWRTQIAYAESTKMQTDYTDVSAESRLKKRGDFQSGRSLSVTNPTAISPRLEISNISIPDFIRPNLATSGKPLMADWREGEQDFKELFGTDCSDRFASVGGLSNVR